MEEKIRTLGQSINEVKTKHMINIQRKVRFCDIATLQVGYRSLIRVTYFKYLVSLVTVRTLLRIRFGQLLITGNDGSNQEL